MFATCFSGEVVTYLVGSFMGLKITLGELSKNST